MSVFPPLSCIVSIAASLGNEKRLHDTLSIGKKWKEEKTLPFSEEQ